MKIYIAAPYPMLISSLIVAGHLKELGFEIISSWLDRPIGEQSQLAQKDLEDIVNAETVLLINPAEWANQGTGGRHFEIGVAYAIRRDIILWGVRSNVFHYLPEIVVVDSFDDVVKTLKGETV